MRLKEIDRIKSTPKAKPKEEVDKYGDDFEQGKYQARMRNMKEWGFSQIGDEHEEPSQGGDDKLMNPIDTTQYRALSARGNFLALDRVDIISP